MAVQRKLSVVHAVQLT